MTANTRIVTPFDASSTSAEVIAGVDLSGRRAIVTGATSGIGTETARALASAGAEVTLAVRRRGAGEGTAGRIRQATGGGLVRVEELDLADLRSVEQFTGRWNGPVDILVNNAGIMAPPRREVTRDGYELQFATNYLGHFALTLGLHPFLRSSGGARVVSVSSVGHLRSPVLFDDINFDRHPYEPWLAYAQSKTATALLAVGVSGRWAADAITANAVHPGGIQTNLIRYQGDDYLDRIRRQYGSVENAPWKTVEQGAATSVLAAASPLLDGVTGRYFEDCNEAVPNSEPPTSSGVLTSGVAPYTVDPGEADRLWEAGLRMLYKRTARDSR